MQESIDKYASQLLAEKGIPETPEAHADLMEQLNEAVDQALFAALSMEQIEELDQAADEGRADEGMLERMLAESQVDSVKVANEALVEFRNNYLKGGENE